MQKKHFNSFFWQIHRTLKELFIPNATTRATLMPEVINMILWGPGLSFLLRSHSRERLRTSKFFFYKKLFPRNNFSRSDNPPPSVTFGAEASENEYLWIHRRRQTDILDIFACKFKHQLNSCKILDLWSLIFPASGKECRIT